MEAARPVESILPSFLSTTNLLVALLMDIARKVFAARVAAGSATTTSGLTTGRVLAVPATVEPGENGYSVTWNVGECSRTRTSPNLPSPHKV